MTTTPTRKLALDRERVALVLQGGGALGAYQGGVFEALVALDVEPAWVAGVSIGAINAALIVGNAPERRRERLREFWDLVSSGPARQAPPFDGQRGVFNQWSTAWSATFGVPGFYQPRVPPAMLQPDGTPAALSVYDNGPLKSTLERLVDFDRINARTVRLSVGAVDVATGNSQWFDNVDVGRRKATTIGPEHIMASGALPPAFAPVVIGEAAYWDGGILSNTPLQYVLDTRGDEALLVFQVDLFPAKGDVPVNLAGVLQRHKDILYSSRSRFTTEKIAEMQRLRGALRRLIERLPDTLRDDPDLKDLEATLHTQRVDIVHLIYRQTTAESESKDYEFSRPSMLDHWARGVADLRHAHDRWRTLAPSALDPDVTVYDPVDGFDTAPAAKDAPDHAEKTALVQVAKRLKAGPRTPKSRPSSALQARSKPTRPR